jgi:cytidine deaminase
MKFESLIAEARAARERAYAPYSRFQVGAALLGKSGRVYTGCNVENLSFGLTICAERAAVCSAIAAGETDFVAAAVIADSREPVTPCGACRQVFSEFSADMEICSVNLEGDRYETRLSVLLPRSKAGILDRESST